MGKASLLGLGAVAAAAGVYAAPSVARLLPPRLRLTPHLSGLGDPGHVALTFDDGPDPRSTPAVLDALEQEGWRATFFLLGTMVEAAPGLANELVDRGHEIAVHGYLHDGAIRRTPRALTDDVTRTRDVIAEATGVDPYWYRPPYGELSAGSWRAASATGLRLILWSAWGRDWRAEATPASVVHDLDRGVLAGGTVLLHDSDCTSAPSAWRNTVAAIPLLADHLAELDLVAGPLRDHGLGSAPGVLPAAALRPAAGAATAAGGRHPAGLGA
jgi:peptidoglycan/xylan/chitin deacetylase (PgdA/CDA1 family)